MNNEEFEHINKRICRTIKLNNLYNPSSNEEEYWTMDDEINIYIDSMYSCCSMEEIIDLYSYVYEKYYANTNDMLYDDRRKFWYRFANNERLKIVRSYMIDDLT